MKPAPFDLHVAADVDDAIAVLSRAGDGGKVIAGGQSLVAMMNLRLARPEVLVDLNRITGLDHVEPTPDGGLRIGAMTRQRALERSDAVRAACPLMAEALPLVAHAAIRNRGTLGGSLAHADSGSELCTVALAVDARLRARGPRGEREIAATDFFQGLFTTALDVDEVLVEIEVPGAPPGTGSAFQEVSRRRGDFALAGAAAVLRLASDGTVEHARLAFTSLGPTPLRGYQAERSLLGARPDDAAVERAGEIAATEVSPADDLHASAEFRRHLASALTRRVLRTAAHRAATHRG